jgi:hypothetical protein
MRTTIINPGSREAKALGWDDITTPVEAIQAGAFLAPSDRPPYRTDLWVPFANGRYRFSIIDASIHSLEFAFRRTRNDGTVEHVGLGGIYQSIAKGRALAMTGAPNWAAVTLIDPDSADFNLRAVNMVIQLGLEGGAQGVVDGKEVTVGKGDVGYLINQHFKGRPLIERWTLAFAILGAALFGRTPD